MTRVATQDVPQIARRALEATLTACLVSILLHHLEVFQPPDAPRSTPGAGRAGGGGVVGFVLIRHSRHYSVLLQEAKLRLLWTLYA
jgi:hypothetical protein